MKDISSLWKAVLDKLELTVSNVSFIMWFKPLKVIDLVDNKTLIISANTTSAKNQISRNYFDKLSQAVNDIFGVDLKIEVLDPSEEIEYVNLHGDKNSEKEFVDVEKNPFNPKYTFDNFVVGKSNQFVYAAARAVAEHSGEKFNPLFIYGGVGLGKTHLLHAIGNYYKEFFPQLNVKYVTCEQFANDYIESLGSASKNKAVLEQGTSIFTELLSCKTIDLPIEVHSGDVLDINGVMQVVADVQEAMGITDITLKRNG